ncbi:MAG: PilN domain-containing protein [Patescibacteria group bacterium]|nr:PilN domain-containing protein [Patescibacteria group bacterium]
MILQTHFNELVNNNTLLNRGPQNHIVAVKNINGNIKKIEDIQNKSIYWSYLIEDIYALTNANILINKIQAESGNNILRLQGSAGTRDALLEFQQNLEKNDIFAEVELPIQSLLSKTNIDFNMSLKLNSYEFK